MRLLTNTRSNANAVSTAKPYFIVPIAFTIFILLGTGPNVQHSLALCASLILGTFLLWRAGEPQILLSVFLFQWLQLAVAAFSANISDLPLVQFFIQYPGVDYAMFLATLALVFLATGIRLGAGRQDVRQVLATQGAFHEAAPIHFLYLHLAALALAIVAQFLSSIIPALSQPLLAIASIKWGTFLLLTISSFTHPKGLRLIWSVVFCLEFAMALGGYFSTFKFVMLYTLVALTAIGAKITLKRLIVGSAFSVLALVTALYWTTVKDEYRWYISGGTAAQAVVVSQSDAVGKLVELVEDVTTDQLLASVGKLASRYSEIDMFSAVVTHVPSVIDHQWAGLWLDSVSRPFMPRLFFPNKAIIDESALTNHYTGRRVAGFESGTQISMGYIADSYIDFGQYWMMVVLFFFGLFLGRSYRWLISSDSGYGVFGIGIASAILMQVTSIGFSSAKLVGGILVCLLVSFVALWIIPPAYIHWLRRGLR